jgi:DNA-binding transcriptional LysR family regulator
MQLSQLVTFVAIAECGTLTAAARRVYKTQGAVSHNLRSLERELGVLLIDRSGQRIRLTPAGEALLPHAIELLRRADDIKSEVARVDAGSVGGVRLGVAPSLSGIVLDQLLSYRRRAPEARFTFFTELQGILVDWLIDGRVDIVVAEPELRNELSCLQLGREDILITLAKDDPLASEPSLAPEALVGRPFIGFIRELASTRVAERFFTPLGHYPSPVVEVDDYRLMKKLIGRGVGFGIMPRSALEESDELVGIPGDPPLQREIAVLTSSTRLLPPGVAIFRDYLASTWQSSAPTLLVPAAATA